MDRSKESLTVVKHNRVIQASYKLSLAEQRVLLSCISRIDSMAELSADNRFEVSAAQITDLANLANKTGAGTGAVKRAQ